MYQKKAPKLSTCSPFNWKSDSRPSIFAQDPYFRGNYKTVAVSNVEKAMTSTKNLVDIVRKA